MLARTKPPFRADHVGSLIRPAALIAARQAAEQGEMPAAELTRIQHDAIRDVVRLQEEIGLRSSPTANITARSGSATFC